MKGFFHILQTKPVFAIHPATGVAMLRAAASIVARETPWTAEAFGPGPEAARPSSVIARNDEGRQVGEVLVYPIHGTLYAQDQYCGPTGMHTHARNMEYFAQGGGGYDAVVLDIQSPGGQVLGLDDMANAIAELRAAMPVVAFVNGMAASAGYRVASEAEEIIMSGASSEVGSIGVMMSFLDYKGWLEKEGIRQINIVSNLSPNKNSFFLSEFEEEDIALFREEDLDPLARQFQEAVQVRRPGVAADSMTGKMYTTEAAIARGLADRQGSYTDAIMRAAELIETRQKDKEDNMKVHRKNSKAAASEAQAEGQQEQSAVQPAAQPDAVTVEALDALREELKGEIASVVGTLQESVDKLAQTLQSISERVENIASAPADAPEGKGKPAEADAGALNSGEGIGGNSAFAYFNNIKNRKLGEFRGN